MYIEVIVWKLLNCSW